MTLSSTHCSNSTLDGHALSIQIVAAQAAGSSSLAGLQERWDEERGAILKQESAQEGRLTSVRAVAQKVRVRSRSRSPGACWPSSLTCPPAWRRAT